MAGLGQITVDECGGIRSVDTAFCAMMRAPEDVLIGRNILDLTSPADRERCIVVLTRVQAEPGPVTTVKRMIRFDDTHIWVHNTVAATTCDKGAVRISIAIEESAPPSDWIEPADLLRIARFIFATRRRRTAAFPGPLFSDHAWDILLAAYISEAEARVLTMADIHAAIDITMVNAIRWMRALGTEGLLEHEDGGTAALITSPIRLSCEAHIRLERYLSDAYRSSDHPVSDPPIFR